METFAEIVARVGATDILARVHAEDRRDLELLRQLSPMAWKWAASYKPGLPGPGPDASHDELMGWRAFLRGYTRRPTFVEDEIRKTDEKRRTEARR